VTVVDLSSATRPHARSDRWQPTRAGLLGLWHYWEETFTFHRGRLLLRGPNGTGKSMALELLLPLVLDADTAPHRLTSAARPRGSLYERIMAGASVPSRAGFAWVEFRRGEDVFTAGVRLRASSATRKVDHAFFTTHQAVGRDLQLLDARREPLSRRELEVALGGAGRIHATKEEHRAAVRACLYPGFTTERYHSVITALLALRREKLSQNLDLDKLSDVLTQALPALDEHDLTVVAEGFERLDRRRAELEALEAEVAEVRSLDGRQRVYARAVLAGVAGRVRGTESERDNVTRAEREATAGLEALRCQADDVGRALAATEARAVGIDDELNGLRSSTAYQEGGQLADLQEQRRVLEGLAVRVEAQRAALAEAAGEASDHQARAEEALATSAATLEAASTELRRVAEDVGAAAIVEEARGVPDGDEGQRLVGSWVTARRRLVAEVRTAVAEHADAVRRRTFAEEREGDDRAAVDARGAARDEARRRTLEEQERYGAALEAWIGGSEAVGPGRLRAALAGTAPHPSAVRPAVDRLAGDLRAEEALRRQSLTDLRAGAVAGHGELVAERAAVAAGGLVDPPAPPWRTDRAGLRGAPLWLLVDAPGDGDGLDGLEAALLGSGLLDAWVGPDGEVDLGVGRADISLTRRPARGPTLADHLVALPDAAVPVELVGHILASIPVVPAVEAQMAVGGPEVTVGLDGSFRLGAAVGSGPLGPARLLGAAARERHRLARLAELDVAIASAEAALADLDRRDADLELAAAAAAADLAALPLGEEVVAAEERLAAATARLDEATDRLAVSRKSLREAEDGVRTALRTLTAVGARHRLPTAEAELAAVEAALGALDRGAGVWARRRHEHTLRAERVEVAATAAARARGDVTRAAEDGRRARAEADSLATRVAALEGSIGAEYAAVLAQISQLSVEQRATRERARALAEERRDLAEALGRLDGAVREARGRREVAERERMEAHRRFAAAVDAGFGSDATLEVPADLGGVTAVLDAARAVLGVVGEADEAATERASSRVDEALHRARSTLGGRVDLYRELDTDGGWWTLRASTGGLRQPVHRLAGAMAGELEAGRRELAVEEEQLFEQVLAGSVRRALADRIRLANHLVEGINGQLAKVRTEAAGLEVRLRWEVDPDELEAVRSARRLLLRDPGDLTDAEAASLQAFVRARVEQARADLEANAPWEARLRETLDYRAWHRFVLTVGHRDWEGHRAATPRLLQRLSTGERSIALHLPMLASIAAHYAGNDGEQAACPRLVLLDELFAGVDAANRAQLFGTFTDWDLDAVFTSDHEWCQYATLDGIAIHQLHPPATGQPVTSTRFWWDGRRRTIDASGP